MLCFRQLRGIKRGIGQAALLGLACLLMPASRLKAQDDPSQERRTLSIANPDFAIADFDGDRKPDLATVEMERSASSARARYSIRLKLTSGDSQVFGLTAPAGGLQIVARDVNGDNALDLLISTTWQHQQVAVILNDGHGNFTLTAPGGFFTSNWGSDAELSSGTVPNGDSVALLRCQTSPDAGQGTSHCKSASCQVGFTSRLILRNSSRLFLLRLLGRAPPAGVLRA
jgi:hypothetical protein